jgi:hypothetical protein
LTRGCQLEVDRRSGDVPRKNVRGNCDSPRRNFDEFVHLLVAPAGDMIELDAVELVLDGSHGVAVGLHLVFVTTRILHDLVNHELRVPPDVNAFDACLNGNSEATKKGLVLHHVVQRGEM